MCSVSFLDLWPQNIQQISFWNAKNTAQKPDFPRKELARFIQLLKISAELQLLSKKKRYLCIMENRKKEIYNRSSGQAKPGDSCPLMHVKQVVPLLSLSMKRKLTLLFLVTMFAGLNVRAAFNLPKDDEGYYLISTPEDLVAFSDYVNNTVNANSSWGRLTADLDMSTVPNFWPIGMYLIFCYPQHKLPKT